MRVNSIRLVTVGLAFGAAALLSACSGGLRTNAPTTVTATPKNQAQQQLQAPAKDSGVDDVNCSSNGGGKVGPHSVDLIADATKAGRVGCTEAFTVISDYFANANKAEGSGRFLTVRGWRCGADTGAQGTGMISCEKDGLTFHTGPVDKPRFPNTKQTVRLTGYNTSVDMVEFQLSRWVPGGANNGHYDDVPGDTGTHRLPLAKSVKVSSAILICPADAPTVDNKGLGNHPCSKDRLLAVLRDGQQPYAQINVNSADEIATINELYTP